MKTPRLFLFVVALALLSLPLSLRAGITVSESTVGDFPNSPFLVTPAFTYTLGSGSNLFSGSAGVGADTGDFFKIVVPPGMKVTNIAAGALTGSFTTPSVPIYTGIYTCGFSPAGQGQQSWALNFTVAAAADYDITTTNGQIILSNRSNFGDTLTFSEVSAGNVQFAAPNRTFSVNGGAFITGNSGSISLNGISSVTVNGGEGGETINVGDFYQTSLTVFFPSLTIHGGAGNDTVNFTGFMVFGVGNSLTVNLQASGSSPGVDAINVTGGISPHGTFLDMVVGVGTIDLECSQSISITAGALVQTYDGDLTVKANQQAAATGGNFNGVYVDGAGTLLQVNDNGVLTVNGRGGNNVGGGQLGVYVADGAQIVGTNSPSSVAVNVTGTGGDSAGSVNRGVTVYGSGSAITAGSGSVNVTGTGGPNGSAFGIGVSVLYGGQISVSKGDGFGGVVNVTGIGRGAAGSGSNQGVEIAGAATPASAITSTQDAGGATITATAGPGASSGLLMSDSAAISASQGDVSIASDSISLDTTATISTANASSKVQISSIAATHIDLGGTDAAGTLGLSAAELARITTPSLEIHSLANGDMAISAPITLANVTKLSLFPGSGGLKAAASGHDLTLPNGGTLFLNGPLNVPITGPNADSGFPQLNIGGGVNLSGATLNLAGTTAPGTFGRQYKIIFNLGGAPIVGTFAGLPEGALMTWPGSPSFYAQISYVGGGGHDVVLTLVSSTPTVTNTADSGPGSLRAALAVAAFRSGADTVTLDPSLSGQTIALSSELLLNDTAGVTIDASSLPGGLTLTSANSRVFEVASGSRATLTGLTIATGKDTTGIGGGAVFNNGGTVTLSRCTLAGNQATNSTTGGNEGGALYNAGGSTMNVLECTLSGNVAPGANSLGGALYNLGTATLAQCTLSGNSAGSGGAIVNFSSLTLTNSIVGDNTLTASGSGPDIFNNSALAATGENLVGTTIVNNGSVNGRSGPVNDPAILTASPMLATLGSYGGPTQTMPPLRGSLAIDNGSNAVIPNDPATGTPFTVDQRGLPRIANGFVDIGAAETSVFVVTNNLDDGSPGSLRQQIAFATDATNTITFASNLAGSTIQFNAASGQLTLANNVAIDASALNGGITLNGGGTGGNYRLLAILPGTSVILRNLVFANAGGNAFTGQGGAVANAGTAIVSQCVFLTNSLAGSGNGGAIYNVNGASMTFNGCSFTGNRVSSTAGGAISNDGTMVLNASTLNANTAGSGGAILNNGALTLNQCTLAGNQVFSQGGAIYAGAGTLNLTQSTVSANSSDDGGGICNAGGTLTLTNSIVAQNTGAPGADINNTAAVARSSRNILGNNDTVATQFPAGTPNGNGDYVGTTAGPVNPLLAPLGNYGGPTQTMALLTGTPAHNAAVNSPFTSDQRGFAITDGHPDIGAYEAGTLNVNFNAYIYETLPATATAAQHAAGFDFDGDGVSNLNEFLAGTNAADATSSLHLTQTTRANGTVTITFPAVSGHTYVAQASPSLTSPTWSDVASVGPNSTGLQTLSFTDPAPGGAPAYFYRVRLGP